MCVLLLLLLAGSAWAAPSPSRATPSLAEALNPDGTLRAGTSGSFDARHFQMLTAPDGRPMFRPAGVRRTTGAGDENWQDGLGPGGTDGQVMAVLAVGTDVYIGGGFSTVGGVPAPNIAKWNGTVWNRIGPGSSISGGQVYALAMVGTNLYAGGSFTRIGTSASSSTAVNQLAKWNGTAWSSVGPAGSDGVGGTVYALATSGTALYVGGGFTGAGGIAVSNVAKWDNATSTWSSLGTGAGGTTGLGNGVNGEVYALAANATDLYVGGQFTAAGGTTAKNVARWAFGTSNWNRLGNTSNGVGSNFVSDRATALALMGTALYVGGSFSSAGGTSASNLARWNITSSTWTPVGGGVTHNLGGQSTVYSLAVSGTTLYVGGGFTHTGTTVLNGIGKFDTATSTWTTLGTGMSLGTEGMGSSVFVRALGVTGSSVYAGGSFRQAGPATANSLALWNGSAWSCPAPGNGADNYLNAIVVAGSDVYVGGGFTHIGGIAANRVAKWNGTAWSSLGTGAANGVGDYPSTVNALAVAGNGDLYVGGTFTKAGGATANKVARWDGTTWSSLGTGTANGVNNTVRALAIIGSDVYVGGSFTQAGGVANGYLAKWNGTTWNALGTGVNSDVYALARAGTTLYAGGQFFQAGGAAIRCVAAWNGSAWSALGGGVDGTVMALAVSGTNVYVGGSFGSGSGIAMNNVAKWNGTAWSVLGTSGANGVSGTVYALAAIGNDVYVGGDFFYMNGGYPSGVSARSIARWTGTTWSSLGTGMSYGTAAAGKVYALGVDVDYHVFAGGDFSTVGDASKAMSFVGIFSDLPPSLTVSATQPLDGSYNNLTITNAGAATLTAPLRVRGTLTVQSGGQLLTASQPITGLGSFALAAGATLGIDAPAGIAATGATGAVQVSGTRTFDAGANYVYSGTQAQVAGPALPASVASLTLSNPAGLTLSQDLTTTQALTLTSGELRTGAAAVILGPTATITETATGFVTGTVEASRQVATPGQSQSFGGLGLTLTPAAGSTTLPGVTTVRRSTGTPATGSTRVGMGRYFDIHAATSTGLDLTMQADYRDEELNGVPEANLVFYRAASSAAGPWTAQTGTYTRDALNNRLTLSGVNGFSVWTLGSSDPLPVELTTFTATAQGPAVQLAWRTASEKNSAYFAVERSLNGREYVPLAKVPAQGSRTLPTSYDYLDATLPAGAALLYYRLRQVDADGTFSYSPVRTLAHPAEANSLTLFPNPAHATATLRVAAAGFAREVRVLDVRGREVARTVLPAYATATELKLTGLPAGVYAVRIGPATARLVVE